MILGGCFGRYFCIWRCQNKRDRLKEREDIIGMFLIEFYGLILLRFHPQLGFQYAFLSPPASASSEQVGAPTALGRSGVIKARLGYALDHDERYLRMFF